MGHRRNKFKKVKVHEPKCPSRTLQKRPPFDLRLLLNKRKLLKETIVKSNKTGTVNINKNVSFQVEGRAKMSRQEVFIKVFQNTFQEVRNETNISKSITSEIQQIKYTIVNKLSSEIEDENSNPNDERSKNTNITILSEHKIDKTNKTECDITQICKRERETSLDRVTVSKDLSKNESSSEEGSVSSDEDVEEPKSKRPRKRHPNRRLTLEKPAETSIQRYSLQNENCSKNLLKLADKVASSANATETALVPATMWENVLNEADLLKREDCWCQGRVEYAAVETAESVETQHNFLKLLQSTTRTLEQTMPRPFLLDQDFYIPPAHVYLLRWKLTDDMTPTQRVQLVCQVRKWPEPEYKVSQDSGGCTAHLLLHGRSFTSKRPAVTAELAREVVAEEFLHSLNLRPRSISNPSRLTQPSFDLELFNVFKSCQFDA